MIAVPTDTPVTLPDPSIPATAMLELLHVPDGVASLNLAVPPTQVDVVPVIGSGAGCTTIVIVFDVAVEPVIQVPLAVMIQYMVFPLARLLLA